MVLSRWIRLLFGGMAVVVYSVFMTSSIAYQYCARQNYMGKSQRFRPAITVAALSLDAS